MSPLFPSFVYRSESFIVGSVYLPQTSDREILSFLTVCDRVSRLGSDHVLIGTDANSWSPAFGGDLSNERGESLLTGLMQIGFTPTRMQSPTRIGNSR